MVIWGQISLFPGRGQIAPSLASWYHAMVLLVIVLGCLLSGVSWEGQWGGSKVGMCFWVTSGGFAVPARLWGLGCASPGLMQPTEAPCCVTLLCKQGTGGCRGFSTQTMLCHAPCISPPAAWRGSVQELPIHFPVGVAGTDFRALFQMELLVEGLSLGCEQLALVSDSCSPV